jgi:hypothetical protein
MTVNNLEALEALIERVKAAQATYATFTQAQVDRIFHQAALAANAKPASPWRNWPWKRRAWASSKIK